MLDPNEVRDVIIIDDDEGVVDVLEMYCEEMGIFRYIVKAYDGQQAAAKLSNQKFHLIIMDVNMPKRTGVEILAEFERFKLNSLSDIVMISGEIDQKMVQQALKYGVKHFLVKPFDEEKFSAKIKPVLEAK